MNTDKRLLIGIDQGTTGTTVLVVNPGLEVVGNWYGTHKQCRPGPGRLEHDPQEILESVIEGVASVLKELGAEAKHVVGIGLANQGETVCAWDINTGQALYNAIVWSDARGNEQIDSVSDEQKQRLREITGLEPD